MRFGYATSSFERTKPPASKWFVAPGPDAEEQPLRADERPLPLLQRRLHRHRLRARVLHVDLEMVLQVLADAGQVVHDVDAERRQLARVADAGELEQLRRVDRAAAEDHLARADRLAADARRRPRAFPRTRRGSTNARQRTSRFGRDIDRMEVRARRAQPPAAADRAVELREALLPVAVDVVRQRVAGLLHRLEERVEERRRRPARARARAARRRRATRRRRRGSVSIRLKYGRQCA